MQCASNHPDMKSDSHGFTTLGKITRDASTGSSRSLWAKAKVASTLRHVAIRRRDIPAARILSDLKLRSIRRAVELAPHMYEVSIDSEYQIGLVSVRAEDGSMLHLPAAIRTDCWQVARRSSVTDTAA